MRNTLVVALCRAREKQRAAYHGRRDGRVGLSVEEAADAPYLVGLRHRHEASRARIPEALAQDLLALEAAAGALRAGREVLRERARIAAEAEAAEYERLAARYGREWQRHHRDRRFARLGWRCPRLSPLTLQEADDDHQ